MTTTDTLRARRADADAPALRILHLSDTHLFGDGSLHYGSVDTLASLHRVLERAAELDSVDVVVASGDLSDDGSARSYRLLRELLDPWAEARGAGVVYAIGNHDGPHGFEAVIGERRGVTSARGFRIIHLDSSIPNAAYGAVDTEQLAWLRAALSEPGAALPGGTVVVIHHPPLPASSALLKQLELQNPAELLQACAGTDVRLILSGHYHYPLVGRTCGIPVVVAPGIANTSDAIAPTGTERATVGAGFAVIDLPADGEPLATFVAAPGPNDGFEIFRLDSADIERIVRESAAPQHSTPQHSAAQRPGAQG